jgi:hypothetical protein
MSPGRILPHNSDSALLAARVRSDAAELFSDLGLVTGGGTIEAGRPKIVRQTGTMSQCGRFIA